MTEAKNYNNFLLDLIHLHSTKEDLIIDFGADKVTFCPPRGSLGCRISYIEIYPILFQRLANLRLNVWSNLSYIENESIDFIYSLNVLEHIKDDEGIITEWYKKLRPGGKLLVYASAFQSLFSSMDSKIGHLYRYCKKGLSKKLREAGFDIITARYAYSTGFLVSLIYKVLGNKEGSISPKKLHIYDRYIFPISRILDKIVHQMFGKNIYCLVIKPSKWT